MASYFCSKCEVGWPYVFRYRVCPGCKLSCRTSSDEPSLDADDAEIVVRHLDFERKYNEREIERFRAEMENILGPSHH